MNNIIKKKKISIIFIIIVSIININLNAETSCSVDIDDINFGNYNIYNNSDLEGISNFTISCEDEGVDSFFGVIFDDDVDVIVYPDEGNSGDSNNRYLISDEDNLNYNLYEDSNYQTIFSEENKMEVTIELDDGEGEETFDYYGLIPALQKVSNGNYSDSLTLTIEY
jgi:spore coat protein U-like protein